jgi:hypothetical protein
VNIIEWAFQQGYSHIWKHNINLLYNYLQQLGECHVQNSCRVRKARCFEAAESTWLSMGQIYWTICGRVVHDHEDSTNPCKQINIINLLPIMIGDLWHKLSQDLVVNLYYYAGETGNLNKKEVCDLNDIQCTPRFVC